MGNEEGKVMVSGLFLICSKDELSSYCIWADVWHYHCGEIHYGSNFITQRAELRQNFEAVTGTAAQKERCARRNLGTK